MRSTDVGLLTKMAYGFFPSVDSGLAALVSLTPVLITVMNKLF